MKLILLFALTLFSLFSGVAMAAQPVSNAPPAWLARATQGLDQSGKTAVGLLVLGQGDQSAYDDAMLRSTSARYALRHLDLVILRREGDRYVSEPMPGQCDGQNACASDAFAEGVPEVDVRDLMGRDASSTAFVVYDAQAHRIGVAHGGFDSLHGVVRFAQALRKATPSDPAVDYADNVLNQIP